jgi:ferredoxin
MIPARDASAFRLHLPDAHQTLDAPGSDTLLLTLQRADVPWPASCRNGTCRACIGRLGAGTVRYRVEWPGLLPEEKAQGCVLPCVAEPTSDVVLLGPG